MIDKLLILIALLNTLIVPMKIEPTKENLYAFYETMKEPYKEMGIELSDAVISFQNISSRGSTKDIAYSPFMWCDGNVAISTKYLYPKYEYYETIDILATLAHETGHVAQVVNCDSKTVEAGATLLSLKALSLMDDEVSRQVFYWYLRDLLIHRLEYEKCITKEDTSKCASGYNWIRYTRAIDWIISEPIGTTVKASSLPVPINVEGILEIEK